MTPKQYKNVIDYTLTQLPAEADSLITVREILRNCGTPLPQGTPSEILHTLLTNEYLAWEECTYAEAIKQANLGVVAIGISGDNIMLIEPQTESAANSAAVIAAATVASRASTKYFIYAPLSTRTLKENPPIPKRISQSSRTDFGGDPDWDPDIWGPYYKLASDGCAVACVSMALSNIGINKTPEEIISDQGGSVYVNWGKHAEGWGDIEIFNESSKFGYAPVHNALYYYYTNPEKYAPPIVHVSSNHYAIVCGYSNKNNTVYFTIDPGYNGYNRKERHIVTDNWETDENENPQVIQYIRKISI